MAPVIGALGLQVAVPIIQKFLGGGSGPDTKNPVVDIVTPLAGLVAEVIGGTLQSESRI